MRGDFSRYTFDPSKRYSGVWMQQGRVQLDADWNEQQAINRHRLETETQDVVGRCGAPSSDPGFEIKVDGEGNLLIGKGRYYVDGMICVNDDREIKYQDQPDLPGAPAIADLLKPVSPATIRYGLVYLDAWQRSITALDDPQIKEIALGGADTATRTKTVWQVKVHPLEGKPSPPCSGAELFRENKVFLNAMTAISDESSTDACIIRPNAGYKRLDNQLYRIEIHKSGKLGEATFKWSQDNGSIEIPIEDNILGREVRVQNIGPTVSEIFNDGPWVEVVDDNSDLNPPGDQPRNLIRLRKDPNTPNNVFSLEEDLSWKGDLKHARLRKWASKDILVENPPTNDGWIPLGVEGIQVKFSAEDELDLFKSGDYWLIPARVASGDIEWPKDESSNDPKPPRPQPPLGIKHHYCKLAVISFNGSKLSVLPDSDCRIVFPPLTGIKAYDVSFDNKICRLTGAKTVQAALENLCQREKDNFNLSIKPGWGWEKALEKIGNKEDARICLKVGIYPLKSTVTLKNKGHIKLIGSGPGTKIIARSSEAALKFEACSSVTVEDLYAESGVSGFWHKDNLSHLNGTLTFSACPKVTIEGVELKCAAAAERAATCITVRDAAEYGQAVRQTVLKPVELVRIHNCDLYIGYQQAGMLLINIIRAQVEGNALTASPRPKTLSLHTLVQNYRYRSTIRHLMVHDAHLGKIQDETGIDGDVIKLSAGKGNIWFKTHPLLISVWPELFKRIPCKGVQKDRDLLLHVMKIADRALLNHGSILKGKEEIFSGFKEWYLQLEKSLSSTASQGIVVGGAVAGDINIINNKIDRALDGIHVGLIRAKTRIDAPVVHVLGNNIKVSLSPTSRHRSGIFIGDSGSLIVENNYIEVERFPATLYTEMEGIRIYGRAGNMAIVKQNHIVDAAKITKGVIFKPSPKQRGDQWIIIDNWPSDARSPA